MENMKMKRDKNILPSQWGFEPRFFEQIRTQALNFEGD